MLWDYLKTLIIPRMTLQTPCMCAGCKRGRTQLSTFDKEGRPRPLNNLSQLARRRVFRTTELHHAQTPVVLNHSRALPQG